MLLRLSGRIGQLAGILIATLSGCDGVRGRPRPPRWRGDQVEEPQQKLAAEHTDLAILRQHPRLTMEMIL